MSDTARGWLIIIIAALLVAIVFDTITIMQLQHDHTVLCSDISMESTLNPSLFGC